MDEVKSPRKKLKIKTIFRGSSGPKELASALEDFYDLVEENWGEILPSSSHKICVRFPSYAIWNDVACQILVRYLGECIIGFSSDDIHYKYTVENIHHGPLSLMVRYQEGYQDGSALYKKKTFPLKVKFKDKPNN
jgi:hypothetical protein